MFLRRVKVFYITSVDCAKQRTQLGPFSMCIHKISASGAHQMLGEAMIHPQSIILYEVNRF
jgi:hypothetical protein